MVLMVLAGYGLVTSQPCREQRILPHGRRLWQVGMSEGAVCDLSSPEWRHPGGPPRPREKSIGGTIRSLYHRVHPATAMKEAAPHE
jgi:hypothetical protein